jgi:hypothetical protein
MAFALGDNVLFNPSAFDDLSKFGTLQVGVVTAVNADSSAELTIFPTNAAYVTVRKQVFEGADNGQAIVRN